MRSEPGRARTGSQTLCPACLGTGSVGVQRCANGVNRTYQLRPCRCCRGTRWLYGLVPPV